VVSILALANGYVVSALGVGDASVLLAARAVSPDNAVSGSKQAENVALVPDSGWKA